MGPEEKGVGLKGWLSGPGQKRPNPDSEGPTALDRHRIAVLPLSNISPDPQDEYFADGMTDEVISTVSKINGLEVISRTSVMQFKKTTKSVRDVSRELGVGTILEGSVRKSGNKLRVSVQIIDAARDKHLWSNSYDREMRDVFEIQSDIAENVADSLKLQLLGEKKAEIKKETTRDVDAYSMYLKGRFYWNERTPDSNRKAMEYFELAIKRDPKFAMAYVGLADGLLIQMDQGYVEPKEALSRCRSLVERALRIDDTLAEAHATLANLLDDEWDWAQAEREYKRAIKINPNLARAYHWYSIFLGFLGRFEEALDQVRIAHRLDPVSTIVNLNIGLRLAEMGRLEEGEEQLRKTIALDPGFGLAHVHHGQVLVSMSRFDEGISELQKGFEILGGNNAWGVAFLGYSHALNGNRSKTMEFREKIKDAAQVGFVPSALFAVLDFILGENDKAYAEMKRAFDEKSNALPYIRVFPLFRLIQADPRIKVLLDRMISSS